MSVSYLLLVMALSPSLPAVHTTTTFRNKEGCVNAMQAETGKSVNLESVNPQVKVSVGSQTVVFTCVPEAV